MSLPLTSPLYRSLQSSIESLSSLLERENPAPQYHSRGTRQILSPSTPLTPPQALQHYLSLYSSYIQIANQLCKILNSLQHPQWTQEITHVYDIIIARVIQVKQALAILNTDSNPACVGIYNEYSIHYSFSTNNSNKRFDEYELLMPHSLRSPPSLLPLTPFDSSRALFFKRFRELAIPPRVLLSDEPTPPISGVKMTREIAIKIIQKYERTRQAIQFVKAKELHTKKAEGIKKLEDHLRRSGVRSSNIEEEWSTRTIQRVWRGWRSRRGWGESEWAEGKLRGKIRKRDHHANSSSSNSTNLPIFLQPFLSIGGASTITPSPSPSPSPSSSTPNGFLQEYLNLVATMKSLISSRESDNLRRLYREERLRWCEYSNQTGNGWGSLKEYYKDKRQRSKDLQMGISRPPTQTINTPITSASGGRKSAARVSSVKKPPSASPSSPSKRRPTASPSTSSSTTDNSSTVTLVDPFLPSTDEDRTFLLKWARHPYQHGYDDPEDSEGEEVLKGKGAENGDEEQGKKKKRKKKVVKHSKKDKEAKKSLQLVELASPSPFPLALSLSPSKALGHLDMESLLYLSPSPLLNRMYNIIDRFNLLHQTAVVASSHNGAYLDERGGALVLNTSPFILQWIEWNVRSELRSEIRTEIDKEIKIWIKEKKREEKERKKALKKKKKGSKKGKKGKAADGEKNSLESGSDHPNETKTEKEKKDSDNPPSESVGVASSASASESSSSSDDSDEGDKIPSTTRSSVGSNNNVTKEKDILNPSPALLPSFECCDGDSLCSSLSLNEQITALIKSGILTWFNPLFDDPLGGNNNNNSNNNINVNPFPPLSPNNSLSVSHLPIATFSGDPSLTPPGPHTDPSPWEIRENIREFVIYPLSSAGSIRRLAGSSNLSTSSLLLYGPKGTGKSHLCRSISYECNAPYFDLSPSLILPKIMGSSVADIHKLVHMIFHVAFMLQPSVIVIDGLEKLLEETAGGKKKKEKKKGEESKKDEKSDAKDNKTASDTPANDDNPPIQDEEKEENKNTKDVQVDEVKDSKEKEKDKEKDKDKNKDELYYLRQSILMHKRIFIPNIPSHDTNTAPSLTGPPNMYSYPTPRVLLIGTMRTVPMAADSSHETHGTLLKLFPLSAYSPSYHNSSCRYVFTPLPTYPNRFLSIKNLLSNRLPISHSIPLVSKLIPLLHSISTATEGYSYGAIQQALLMLGGEEQRKEIEERIRREIKRRRRIQGGASSADDEEELHHSDDDGTAITTGHISSRRAQSSGGRVDDGEGVSLSLTNMDKQEQDDEDDDDDNAMTNNNNTGAKDGNKKSLDSLPSHSFNDEKDNTNNADNNRDRDHSELYKITEYGAPSLPYRIPADMGLHGRDIVSLSTLISLISRCGYTEKAEYDECKRFYNESVGENIKKKMREKRLKDQGGGREETKEVEQTTKSSKKKSVRSTK